MATKPTGPSNRSGKTPARKRRSAPKSKPKTIDLKAEPAKPADKAATSTTAADTSNAAKAKATKPDTTKVATPASDDKPGTPKTSVPKSGPPATSKSGPPAPGKSDPSAIDKTDAAKPSTPPASTSPAKPASTATPSTDTPSAKRADDTSSGFGSLLAASLIGGVIALGGAWILGAFEAGTAQDTAVVSVADLDATRTALEERIAAIQPGETPDVAALIDARLAQQPVADTGETAAAIDAARERITALETTIADQSTALAALRDAGPSNIAAQNDEELTALTTRVDDVTTRIDDVAASVENVSTSVEALRAATGDVAALATRVDEADAARTEITTRLDAIDASLEEAATARTATGERLDGITAQLDATGSALSKLQQTVEQRTAGVEERLTGLAIDLNKRASAVETTTDERIATLTDRIDNGADKLAARALAAAALKRDIDTGSPFDGSLQTLANVSDDTAGLDVLRPYAERGVPTMLDLRSNFDSVAEEIRAATRETPAEQTFAEKLLAGARNAVQVSSADDAQSNSVDGTIARIDNALASGDLAKAGTEWATLPEAGQAASRAWHDSLQARIIADTVVGDTVDAFLNRNTTN